MGFLKRDYNKPGPGVEKDEAPSVGFIQYFKLYFRNLSKMIGYGVIYFILMLPLICYAVSFVCTRVNPQLMQDYLEAAQAAMDETVVAEGQTLVYNSWFVFIFALVNAIPTWLLMAWVAVSAIVIGPINCGIVYCMRNHARQEHAWFTDMFTQAWRNRKQGLFFGIFDCIVTFSLLIYLFSTDSMNMPTWLFTYLKYIAIGFYILYQVMRWYIYQMIVTFSLKLRGLFKNSWMFVVLGAGRNIIAALASVLMMAFFVCFPLFYPSAFPFFLLLMAFLAWSMVMFLCVFTTYPVMHKYLVAPALAERRKNERLRRKAEAEAKGEEFTDDEPEQESDSKDDEEEEEDDDDDDDDDDN